MPAARAIVEDFKAGDRHSFTVEITDEVVRRFVELTGDTNPLHLSDEFAASVGMSRRVVHGMACASFLSRLVGLYLPGPGALWAHQSLSWEKPVRVGDKLTFAGEVIHVSTGQSALTIRTEAFNERGERVLSGTGQVTIPGAKIAPDAGEDAAGKVTPSGNPRALRNVVLVTGGAGAVGSRVCTMLARAGSDVAVQFRTESERSRLFRESLQAENPNVRTIAVQADLSEPDEHARVMDRVCAELGPPDALVLNASLPPVTIPLESIDWDRHIAPHMNVTLRAHFGMIRMALPFMKEKKSGRIVGVLTNAAISNPVTGYAAYTMAKVSLRSLLQAVAAEYGPYGITANGVLPGLMETAMTEGVSERQKELAARRSPTRRLTTPADVASAIMYLISPAASQVNGVMLPLDGGEKMS